METLEEKKELACWIARRFFDKGMGPGTTGNLSFVHDGQIYITGGGSCFGRLRPDQFAILDRCGGALNEVTPSKEWPLHLDVYRHDASAGAVIHIHSTYAVLWSCLPHENEYDCVPAYTPYLKMKLGTVGLVPFAEPGSTDLFDAFRRRLDASDGWILKNHGMVVRGKTLMDAFAMAEELEESCRIAWELQGKIALCVGCTIPVKDGALKV